MDFKLIAFGLVFGIFALIIYAANKLNSPAARRKALEAQQEQRIQALSTSVLKGPNLSLRPLTKDDREALYSAASDPLIWAGHPAKTRHERDIFDPYFDFLLHAGGTLVVTDVANRIVGCSRYYAPPNDPAAIAIGYTFLERALWGGPANAEIKTLMIDLAFEHYDRLWLHIDPDNIRSQKAAAKIGAQHTGTQDLVMAGKTGTWSCWLITRDAWQSRDPR